MYFVDALQFPFQDQNWITKVAIAVVLLFIPIIGWMILSGYIVRLVKMIMADETTLPEFDDFGGDLSRGFMVFLGYLLYYIPVIILSCCSAFIPNDEALGAALNCVFSLTQFGYGILIVPIVFSGVARFTQQEDFGVFLDFGGRINDVTEHLNDAVMLWLNYFILSLVMGIIITIGLFLCCIPGLVAAGVFYFANAYLIATWGKVLGLGGGSPIAPSSMGGSPQTIEPLG